MVPLVTSPISLAMFTHPPVGGISAQQAARQLGAAVFHKGDEQYRDQMRAAGFQGKVLQYLAVSEVSGPVGVRNSTDPCGSYGRNPGDVTGIAGDFCTALNGDERNFLHNGKGERLYTADSWKEGNKTVTVAYYVMNPAAPAWRAYSIAMTVQNARTAGYDGIFLDNLAMSMQQWTRKEDNSDGSVLEYRTSTEWRQALTSYLAELRGALGPGVPLWANMISGSDNVNDWDPFLPYLDGVLNEFFAARWDGSYAEGRELEVQLDQAERTLAAGKEYVMVAQGDQSNEARMRFGLTSYLLVAGKGAFFRYADYNEYSEMWSYNDYGARLGQPVGARYQVNGLWKRDFQCGSVTVDPVRFVGTIAPTCG